MMNVEKPVLNMSLLKKNTALQSDFTGIAVKTGVSLRPVQGRVLKNVLKNVL